jgi:hypothetical protein
MEKVFITMPSFLLVVVVVVVVCAYTKCNEMQAWVTSNNH